MPDPTILVTGYPSFLARLLLRRLAGGSSARVLVLVRGKFLERARRELLELAAEGGVHFESLEGDVAHMHLGLTGEEYGALVESCTDIFHLATISWLGVPESTARRVNVGGTRNILELAAEAASLVRLNHLSTCFVSGDRTGVILEEELEMGQRFRNHFERTAFEAERLVRAAWERLPISIYRPSIVVGDSSTGEIDRFEGPYLLGILLLGSPFPFPLPLPGDGVAPLNCVPADFVADALLAISRQPESAGRCFHLVDPNPLSVRRVYELIAERRGRRLPRGRISARLAKAVLGLPGLERRLSMSRQAVDYLNHLAWYNNPSTLAALEGSGVLCPPLTAYLDRLIAFVEERFRARRRTGPEDSLADDDPLA